MKDIKSIFGMKPIPIQKFIQPERQSIEQTEDYAVKKHIATKELIAGKTVIKLDGTAPSILSSGANMNFGLSDANSIRFMVTNFSQMVLSRGRIRIAQDSTNGADVSSILDISSTVNGFLPPRMTTAQKNTLGVLPAAEGLIIYDTDLHKLCVWTGAAWETFTSA